MRRVGIALAFVVAFAVAAPLSFGQTTQAAKGINNREQSTTAAVSGGENNTARGNHSTIAGGLGNNTVGDRSSIAGGRDNIATATGTAGSIGGGSFNEVRGDHGTISGGTNGHAVGIASVVAGGRGNRAIGHYAAIGGGDRHTAAGDWSTVPGGVGNVAAGDFSFAAGRSARVSSEHPGALLLADASTGRAFNSEAANEFAVRATGGVRLRTGADLAAGATLAAGSGAWDMSLSDRLLRDIEAVDPEEILFAVAYLPVRSWSWSEGDASIRHLGPSAEAFSAAFGLGTGETISTIDAGGVALSAIQALYERLLAAEARIEVLEALLDATRG